MRRVRELFIGAALAVSLSLPAHAEDATPAKSASPDVNTVLATVNGTDITLAQVIALTWRLPKKYQGLPDKSLYQGILEQLIQQTALMQKIEGTLGREAKLSLANERRSFMAAEMIQRISNKPVSEAEIKAAYDARYTGKAPEEEANAAHILVKTEDEAREIAGLLKKGGDFAELARERSKGPSGPNGGELGWLSRGEVVKPFADALFALKPGEISGPVKSQFGWHIIKLNEKRTKATPKLEDVRDDIVQELRKKMVSGELARITSAAKVTRSDVPIDPAVIRRIDLLKD